MIEATNFKKSMSKFATGVAIVTSVFEKQKIGITINSFNSVALEPPLILFSLEKKSARYEKFINQQNFTVNILSQSQRNLSELFAWNKVIDWERIGYRNSDINGCPILEDVTSYFECSLHDIFEGGDHSIIIGKVESSKAFDLDPLIYHDGAYKKIGARI